MLTSRHITTVQCPTSFAQSLPPITPNRLNCSIWVTITTHWPSGLFITNISHVQLAIMFVGSSPYYQLSSYRRFTTTPGRHLLISPRSCTSRHHEFVAPEWFCRRIPITHNGHAKQPSPIHAHRHQLVTIIGMSRRSPFAHANTCHNSIV